VSGGTSEGEVEEGVGEGDGETRQDALVDAGLAGADEAAQLLGAVARLLARAPLTNGHERGEVVTATKRARRSGVRGPASAASKCPATRTRSATAARSFQPGPLTGVRRVGSITRRPRHRRGVRWSGERSARAGG